MSPGEDVERQQDEKRDGPGDGDPRLGSGRLPGRRNRAGAGAEEGKIARERHRAGQGVEPVGGAVSAVHHPHRLRFGEEEGGEREACEEERPAPAGETAPWERGQPCGESDREHGDEGDREAAGGREAPPVAPAEHRQQHGESDAEQGDAVAEAEAGRVPLRVAPQREHRDPGERDHEDGGVREKPVGAVEEQSDERPYGRSAHDGVGDASAVANERRERAEGMIGIARIRRCHQSGRRGERDPGTAAEAHHGNAAQCHRGERHPHVQPGQGGQRRRPERRAPGRLRRQHLPQTEGEAERNGDLGVDERGVEEDRRPDRGGPGHHTGALVAGGATGHVAHEGAETCGKQRQDEGAGGTAAERISRREQDGQAAAVRRVVAAVAPEPAGHPVEPPQVLQMVAAREVVAQVQVALAPDALGHEQVVDLVTGGLDGAHVADRDGRSRAGGKHEQESARKRRHAPARENARGGEPKRRCDEDDRKRPRQEPERGQRTPRERKVSEKEEDGRLEQWRAGTEQSTHGLRVSVHRRSSRIAFL